jgi:Transposase.
MANLKEYEKLTVQERRNRYFSEDFKRKKVSEIERRISSVAEVCRAYQVSDVSVYNWIHRYSRMKKKQERLVLESLSDTRKIITLKQQIKELEQIVGKKQIQIDFLEKLIELAGEELGVDIKKKISTPVSDGFGRTGKNTRSK